MKKNKYKLNLLTFGLISAGLMHPVMAATVKEAKLPWYKQTLAGATHGGDWAEVKAIYTTDFNNDNAVDIIRLGDDSNRGTTKILMGFKRIEAGNNILTRTSFDPDAKNHFYLSNEVGFRMSTLNNLSNQGMDLMDGDDVKLYFGDFDDSPGKDMIRQESTSRYGDDFSFSAQIHGRLNEQQDSPSTFCNYSELHEDFNGERGSTILVGDFNGDGYDDTLRADNYGWAGNGSGTVEIHYAAIASKDDCNGDSALLGLTKATNDIYADSNSQGSDADPLAIFEMDRADVMVGDFNADGIDDIFRFDTDDRIGNSEGSSHVAAGIWFGMPNRIDGRMYRSNMYDDTDNNWNFNSSDKHLDNFKGQSSTNKRIGDFNGDGADDILTYSGNDIKILLSRAVKVSHDNTAGRTVDKRSLGLFKEVVIDNILDFSLDLASVEVRIADFNQDGRDDVLVYKDQPYILYSQIPDSKANGAKPVALTAIKHAKTIVNNTVNNDGFSKHNSTVRRLLEVADFTSDGYPDILYVSSDSPDASLFVTPPYNPLDEIKAQHSGTVDQMEKREL